MPIASGGKGHEWFENIEGLMLASTVKTMSIILDRLMFSLLIFYFLRSIAKFSIHCFFNLKF